MTPFEKATELISKFSGTSFPQNWRDIPEKRSSCTMISIYQAKLCALIAVDEMLTYARKDVYRGKSKLSERDFLLEVKKELTK